MSSSDVTRIAGNIGAMNALNALKEIDNELSIHQTRLSTGKQINSAADDPAGLSIATRMKSEDDGMGVALSNIGDGQNLLSVAESGMSNINDILVQMRDLTEEGASDTMDDSARSAIQTQLQAYASQINDIADQTKWNDTQLIGSSTAAPLRLQTGVDSSDATVVGNLGDMHATGSLLDLGTEANVASLSGTDSNITSVNAGSSVPTLSGETTLTSGSYSIQYSYTSSSKTLSVQLLDSSGNPVAVDDGSGKGTTTTNPLSISWDASSDKTVDFGNGMSVTFNHSNFTSEVAKTTTGVNFTQNQITLSLAGSTADDYASYMDTIQNAINTVSSHLSSVGAMEDSLQSKESQITAEQTNIEASYNSIMNADMAQEQVDASKYEILQQTATAMLAQANSAPQFLLKLFQ